MIDPNKPVGMPPPADAPAPTKAAADSTATPATPALGSDHLGMTTKVTPLGPPTLKLVDAPAVPDVLPAKASADRSERPWSLKTMNIRYGLIFKNDYAKSDLHVTDPVNGTNMTIHDVQGRQRTSAHYLYSMPNGHPQPDEPQYELGISGRFQNDWGFEANVKHHKYVVMTGEDPDQQVRMTGTLNGAPVDEVRSLRGYLPEYQITNGLNQISVMATRAFDLPHLPGDGASYNLKAGPSVMMPYVKSTVVNQDGSTTSNQGPYQFGGGFGGQIEHSIRYDIRNRVSLELTQGASVMTVNNGAMPNGGKANQTVMAHSVALTVGYTFGQNWGNKK